MEKENRTIQLHFYVTETENERIKQGMTETGIVSLSEYLRQMAINGYILRLDMKDLREMTRLLSICSNNLNQYTKKAHETDSINAADIDDLNERFDEIVELAKTLMLQISQLIEKPPRLRNRKKRRYIR